MNTYKKYKDIEFEKTEKFKNEKDFENIYNNIFDKFSKKVLLADIKDELKVFQLIETIIKNDKKNN